MSDAIVTVEVSEEVAAEIENLTITVTPIAEPEPPEPPAGE